MIREFERNHHLASTVDEADVAVFLHSGQVVGENPSATIFGRDGYTAGVSVVESAFAVGAEHAQAVGRMLHPVELDILGTYFVGYVVND